LHCNKGAAHGKRKLILRANNYNKFTCPIKLCLHADFSSIRGLRKHIDNKHPWYYYFDKQPEVKREEVIKNQPVKMKATTSKMPSFSLDEGVGLEFFKWLCTSCGGGKNEKEARQIGKRTMKFFMEALGNNNSDNDLTYEFVDCCLSSASVIISFLQTLEEKWKLSSSASLNYVKAIVDMVDFRKSHGVSDNTLRCFAVTEVYLRRAKENLRKKKNIECTRNLDLETLIAKDSWATMEDMEKVVPFHMKRFRTVIRKCTIGREVLTKGEIVFCIRFITTLLFLRVKCSRPMTYQYLTVTMVKKAKYNGGFIDQTEFKTAPKYIFDTLIITEDVMEIIELYLQHIRPRLDPKNDYLLISTNGTQFQSITTSMTMLVHQAIGKYINPTRYRQIVETESGEKLTLKEQQYVSEDQKHSSKVAEIYYKKKHSRKVAIEGKRCMDKMTSSARYGKKYDLKEMFNDLDDDYDGIEISREKKGEFSGCNTYGSSSRQTVSSDNDDYDDNGYEEEDPYQPFNKDDSTDLTISNSTVIESSLFSNIARNIPNNDVVIKKEVVNLVTKRTPKNIKFSQQEDEFLLKGIQKYGKKSWACILKDTSYIFHSTRTRDSLRMRADSAAFKKLFR